MTRPPLRLASLRSLIACAASILLLCTAGFAQKDKFLGSKTTYSPQQDATTYEAPPSGFSPIFTETVARHGSRGLSSASNDVVMYNMWLAAQASGELTKKGEKMGVELLDIMRANALLGYNVPGITAPGYGNLTQTGITEHTQLAQRLAARTEPLLKNALTGFTHRQVVVSTSGVNRAIDSANFFVTSLAAAVPGLGALIVNSDPLTAYPVNAPVMQGAGINRFQLYFP